ncbi:MAG: hypothetical protein M3326_14700 [Actinomycetota bacterium]|nr:hypothetical protein [Actinomycetota bacterium]
MASAGLTACKQESVHVGFRPEAGASYRYEIKVQSVITTVLGDDAPERSVDEVTLESRDTVLSAKPEEIRVQVQLRRSGSPDRTFQVRFDRGARLAGVDQVDGLPPEVLGSVGFPEFLPAAATAPPDRPLSPGEKWKIDATSSGPGGQSARLEGTGRLVKVTTAGGRKVASIKAETRLPLSTTSAVAGAMVTISGTETTESTAARTLTDGAVQTANAVTKGEYTLTLSPAAGPSAMPVAGTMSVEIRSQTRRLPDEVKASR